MTRQRRLILASILVAWVGMVLACGGGGRTSHPSQKTGTTEKTIPYEVLKRKTVVGTASCFSKVLVSEQASKQEVMKLAESLQREHNGKFAHILIFDSREAWRRRHKDGSAPEKELSRHLVVIAGISVRKSAAGDRRT